MEKIFLIGVVCVILISIAVVDARKKKIPNILLGILFSVRCFPDLSFRRYRGRIELREGFWSA